jgi:hypothetical protein
MLFSFKWLMNINQRHGFVFPSFFIGKVMNYDMIIYPTGSIIFTRYK